MSKPEKLEERKFVRKVRALGAECLKQGGMGRYGTGGYNDQLCLGPYGVHGFFEFKAIDDDGKKEEPTKRQQSRHRLLKRLGYKTFVVYSKVQAFNIMRKMMMARGVPKSIYKHWR